METESKTNPIAVILPCHSDISRNQASFQMSNNTEISIESASLEESSMEHSMNSNPKSDSNSSSSNSASQSEIEIPLKITLNFECNPEEEKVIISEFVCSICQEQKLNSELFTQALCMHIFCKNCITEYLTIRISESNVLKMPCPHHDCTLEILEADIINLIPENLYKKYQIFKRNEELNNSPFLRWCPVPDCIGYDIGNMLNDKLTCNVCEYKYCYYCSEPWHINSKCKEINDKELDKWGNKNNVRYCPNCRRKVEKNNGCNHMTCVKCNYEWCWLCGEKYDSEHYANCEIIKHYKWNKPMLKILTMIFAFFVLLFLPIGWFIKIVHQEAANVAFIKFRKLLKIKWLSYTIAIIFGIIILPIYWSLGPFALSTFMCFNILKNFECYSICIAILSFIFGIITAPIIIILGISAAGVITLSGIVMLGIKVYIIIRRCWEPGYFRLNGKYGSL
ncbi:hypothetical protein SteCoe_18367 [Stentor coeruleus]|uniref:RBR-type E3 ubiquitin transferase n=1 Tax=Stentor coeruleus TaxID=5963 RepID=A0A1R2BWV4_9CILI|nr:hypothetical protein SteCoe_18367 [Stentor coeruleus]